MELKQHISSLLQRFSLTEKVYVAFSGGLDSHVLLLAASKLPELQGRLSAIYINHGLQEVAIDWEKHCTEVANKLNLPCSIIRVNAQAAQRESPEEAARNARYQAFSRILDEHAIFLLAQHLDDQLETVLLQLFRGAGLAGLAGMPEIMPLGRGFALRPFLNVPRQTLEKYAKQHDLVWVEDPTNAHQRYDRNYLRHAVVPLIRHRWPAIATTVARSRQALCRGSKRAGTADLLDITGAC